MNAKEQTVAELMDRVTKLMSSLRIIVRIRLKDDGLDLTIEMLQVLRCLFDKEGINQQEIANSIAKDKASLTPLINNLTTRKLVKRIEDANDRRNKLIFLTKKGLELKEKSKEWMKEIYTLAGNGLQLSELKSTFPLLDKMVENLEKR